MLDRLVFLLALIAAAAGAILWSRQRSTAPLLETPAQLAYVTTAHQLGVVGYRDPVGAISPDGRLIAFSEGRWLFEMPIGGGARVELAAAEGQIRHVAPHGSSGEWLFDGGDAGTRWWVASSRAPARALFGTRGELEGMAGGETVRARVTALGQLVTSHDGKWIAGVVRAQGGSELWKIVSDGSKAEVTRVAGPIAWPAWSAAGDLACTRLVDGRWRLSLPCGQESIALQPDIDVMGPLAVSPATGDAFFASPTSAGMVELWSVSRENRRARRVAAFSRDTYAPSITTAGEVLFKTQSYRTSVAELDLASSKAQQLSTLQAETPSYHPDGRRIAVTFGTWRRVIDDAKYPDIAQEIGVIRSMPIEAPAGEPVEIIANSDSEDQAIAWSPNGKWIVYHSHREQSDDIWLRPVDKHVPDRRISFLGRGAEVGWPRWSPDGRWVLYDGASKTSGRSVMYVIGLDQESGAVTSQSREVAVTGFEGEITHGEWLPDNATIVAIAKEAPGRHAIVSVPAQGGTAAVLHRFFSEHDFPGLAVAPDGSRVAFVAPATDGFHQIFALALAGGTPQQLTFDRTHKTQPAWSPDGTRIAFTIWSYDAQFWLLPRR